MDLNAFENDLIKFNKLCNNSESFLLCDNEKSKQFLEITKHLYDATKHLTINDLNHRKFNVNDSLETLHVNRFNDEQIWQMIELENNGITKKFINNISKLSAQKKQLSLKIVENDKNKPIHETDLREGITQFNEKRQNNNVDDQFFKLKDLEKFLDTEDAKENTQKNVNDNDDDDDDDDDDDEIDYFMDEPSDGENDDTKSSRNAMYDQFFDNLDDDFNENDDVNDNEYDSEIDMRDADVNANDLYQLKSSYAIDNDDDGDSDDDSVGTELKNTYENNEISEFEHQQNVLRNKISKMENMSLGKKQWQLYGEITSDKRPENSLLEEHLQFDHVTRPAPLITEESTQKIEDIIKQRIKDSLWDDVQRKTKPTEQPFEYKRRITLDYQKSKVGLAQVYEKEFLKQNQEKTDEENPEHKEIKKLITNLGIELDALSNFNFTPRPPRTEIKIINNLPAITAEEPTPVGVSDASMLAPEEVFKKVKTLKSNNEKTKTDKKRERRIKKSRKVTKPLNLKQKKSKNKAKGKDSALLNDDEKRKVHKSSKEFFTNLQDTVNKSIKKTKKFKNKPSVDSRKLKL